MEILVAMVVGRIMVIIDVNQIFIYILAYLICIFNNKTIRATSTGYVDIQSESESNLTAAIATIGPISVAIDASKSSFHYYNSGIYDDQSFSKTQLDHAVTAVGYSLDNGTEFYIVNNS